MLLRDIHVVKEVVSAASAAIVRCTICQENVKSPMLLQCNDIFCKLCLEKYLRTAPNKPRCPNCNVVINKRACYKYPGIENTPFHNLIQLIETTTGTDWTSHVKDFKVPSEEFCLKNVYSNQEKNIAKSKRPESIADTNELLKNNPIKEAEVEIEKIIEIYEETEEKQDTANKLPRNYFRRSTDGKSSEKTVTLRTTNGTRHNRFANIRTYERNRKGETDLQSFSQCEVEMIFPGEIVSTNDGRPKKTDSSKKPIEKVSDWLYSTENDFERCTLTQTLPNAATETASPTLSIDRTMSDLQRERSNPIEVFKKKDVVRANSISSEELEIPFGSSGDSKKEKSDRSEDSLQTKMDAVFDKLVCDTKLVEAPRKKSIDNVQSSPKKFPDSIFELFYTQTINDRGEPIDSIETGNDDVVPIKNTNRKLQKKRSEEWSRVKKSQLSRTEKSFKKLNVSIESTRRTRPLELKCDKSSEEIVIDEFDSLEKVKLALKEIDGGAKESGDDRVLDVSSKGGIGERPADVLKKKNIVVEESPTRKSFLKNVDSHLNKLEKDKSDIHSDIDSLANQSFDGTPKNPKKIYKFFKRKSETNSGKESNRQDVSNHDGKICKDLIKSVEPNKNKTDRFKRENVSLEPVTNSLENISKEKSGQKQSKIVNVHESESNILSKFKNSDGIQKHTYVTSARDGDVNCLDLNENNCGTCISSEQISSKKEQNEPETSVTENSKQAGTVIDCKSAKQIKSIENVHSVEKNKSDNYTDVRRISKNPKDVSSSTNSNDRSISCSKTFDCKDAEIKKNDIISDVKTVESENHVLKQTRHRSVDDPTKEHFEKKRRLSQARSEEGFQLDVVQTLPDRFSDILKPLNCSDSAVPILRLMEKLPTCRTFADLMNEIDDFSQSLREKIINENNAQTENRRSKLTAQCPKCFFRFDVRVADSSEAETLNQCEKNCTPEDLPNDTVVPDKSEENFIVISENSTDTEIMCMKPVHPTDDVWETETIILSSNSYESKRIRNRHLGDTQVLTEPKRSADNKNNIDNFAEIDFDDDCFDSSYVSEKSRSDSPAIVIDLDLPENVDRSTEIVDFEDFRTSDDGCENSTVVPNYSKNVSESHRDRSGKSNNQCKESDKTVLVLENQIENSENDETAPPSGNTRTRDLYPEVIIKNIETNITNANNSDSPGTLFRKVNRHLSYQKPGEIFDRKTRKRTRSASNSDSESEDQTPKKNKISVRSNISSPDYDYVIENTPQKHWSSRKLSSSKPENRSHRIQVDDDNLSDVLPLSNSSTSSSEIILPTCLSNVEVSQMDHLHRMYTPPADFQDLDGVCIPETEFYEDPETSIRSDNDATLIPETETVSNNTIVFVKSPRNVSALPDAETFKNLKTPTPNIDIMKLKTRSIKKYADFDDIVAYSGSYVDTPRLQSGVSRSRTEVDRSTPKENAETIVFEVNDDSTFSEYETPKTRSSNENRNASDISHTSRLDVSKFNSSRYGDRFQFNTPKVSGNGQENNSTNLDYETPKFLENSRDENVVLNTENSSFTSKQSTFKTNNVKSQENLDKRFPFGNSVPESRERMKPYSRHENHSESIEYGNSLLNQRILSDNGSREISKSNMTKSPSNTDYDTNVGPENFSRKNTDVMEENVDDLTELPLSELQTNIVRSMPEQRNSNSENYKSPVKNTEDLLFVFETPQTNDTSIRQRVSEDRENRLDVFHTGYSPRSRLNVSDPSKRLYSKDRSSRSIVNMKPVGSYSQSEAMSRQKSIWNYINNKSHSRSSQDSKISDNDCKNRSDKTSSNNENENVLVDDVTLKESNKESASNERNFSNDSTDGNERRKNDPNGSLLKRASESDHRDTNAPAIEYATSTKIPVKRAETQGFDTSFCLPNSFVSQSLARSTRNVGNTETQFASMRFGTPNTQAFENPVAFSTPKLKNIVGNICVTCSRLSTMKESVLKKFCEENGFKFSADKSSDFTHLVMETNSSGEIADLTLKYLNGLVNGRWVLSFDWVLDCIEKKQIVDEEHYEVSDNTGFPGARVSRLADKNVKIFKDFDLCIVNPMVTCTVEDIQLLVIKIGARVFKSPEQMVNVPGRIRVIATETSHVEEWHVEKFRALFEKYGIVTVDFEWITQSICQHKPLSFSGWLLCESFMALDHYPTYLRVETEDCDTEM